MDVVVIRPTDTHPLRRAVLRDGTADDEVVFDGDDLPTTFHLGVRDGGDTVAISTWIERRYPDLPALAGYQVRGMATSPGRRGEGLGARLLAAGIGRCTDAGAGVVWARARLTALAFYERHGFEPRGLDYVDLTTGLPHCDIVRLLVPDAG